MADWLARAHDAFEHSAAPPESSERRFAWVLYRQGHPPLEVRFLPELSLSEVEARYPGTQPMPLDEEAK